MAANSPLRFPAVNRQLAEPLCYNCAVTETSVAGISTPRLERHPAQPMRYFFMSMVGCAGHPREEVASRSDLVVLTPYSSPPIPVSTGWWRHSIRVAGGHRHAR